MISEPTRRLSGGLFDVEEVAPHALKGFSDPLRAYRVLGEGQAEGRFEAMHGGGLAPLVGRVQELALLLERWERAKDGEGQVVLLAGKPASASRVSCKPYVKILRRRHIPHLANIALHFITLAPSIQSPTCLSVQPSSHATIVLPGSSTRSKRPRPRNHGCGRSCATDSCAALHSDDGRYSPLGFSPQRQKERTLEVLLGQLAGLAGQQPVLALYEDVHWADPTTLELLDLVVDDSARCPLSF